MKEFFHEYWQVLPVLIIILAPVLIAIADSIREAEEPPQGKDRKSKVERVKAQIEKWKEGAFAAPLLWYATFLCVLLLAFPEKFKLWYGKDPLPQPSFLSFQVCVVLIALTSKGKEWARKFFMYAAILLLPVVLVAGSSPFQDEDEEDEKEVTRSAQQAERMVWKMYPEARPKVGERWKVHNPHVYPIHVRMGVYPIGTPQVPPGEDWFLNITRACGTPPFYVLLKEGDEVTSVTIALVK
ncbi:MAG: hypothetical protein COT39_04365 [Parcubacteria group bacterium CG08_land_8_20_14_0_20_48_21]|nr:MAG: hypothetical protein AUK21_01310 [Parcubacteria group bacterium CG2_30_48_51]PIS32445.1 MAG: hypothetical protein COT39_04365 [Parcubacteria group bacterium CG08_land_8_20_14_0_20_48_21]PIW79590.1 MAG: hypothetical protein COZ99_00190 [Parcubacteria group bacterium CG_4_8_14_3_um_filter_48_16]PIY78037.1 MAG: hypothetical protein COY83_01830 [Parcubacteria group bacterium CG_4_10_14_0_8_um_filter_48_154]PIZ77940.1 MAG: hypothetical protein COY03_01180 [bacterium CG_4_10_14_0_2_um_filter_